MAPAGPGDGRGIGHGTRIGAQPRHLRPGLAGQDQAQRVAALDVDGGLLPADERTHIDGLMEQLRNVAAASHDAGAIEAATQALAKGTEAFAAERMNHSIQQALAGKNVEAI